MARWGVSSNDTHIAENIKWFVDRLGNDGLYGLLAGHEDKSAYCQCVLAFSAGPGAEPLLWVGKTHGTIVQPSGDAGFGWDACFVPDGKGMAFADLPASWVCPVCGAPKSSYKAFSTTDGQVVWGHD